MIFESKEEEEAFDFVCSLAWRYSDERGCNDLADKDINKFENYRITRVNTLGPDTENKLIYDFDVINWIQGQQHWLVDELPEELKEKFIAFKIARGL